MFRRVFPGLFPVLLPVLLVAAVEAQRPLILTESEFLSVLDDQHPAVAEQLEAVATARAHVVGASTFENPTLGLSRQDLRGSTEEMEWTLSWQLPESSRGLGIQAREVAVEAAEARLFQDRSALRQEMRQVYAQWAAAAARRHGLVAQAARIEALADREAQRAEQGEASGLEAHRLALAAAGLQAQVALAGAAEEGARGRVQSWYPDLPANSEPILPSLPLLPDLEGDHPLLRAAQADLDAAILEQRVAGRFVRSPEVTVGWKREEATAESFDGPILGLGWSVPLFARKQGDQAMAEARVVAARARLEIVRREIGSARAAAVATYQRLARALEKAETALVGNERMLAGAEAAFRLGEGTLTDLLDTLRLAAEAETAKLDLHQAALAAHRESERLVSYHEATNLPSNPVPEEPIP